ncbi:MAG: membrane protein insertion efficiency factor YidD [Mycobacterium sp.]
MKPGIRRMATLPVRALVFLIQLYRHTVSPLRLPTCRFTPTCSQYAVEALTEFGLLRGSWLTIVRLAKCGPWHRGGWDPIPEHRHGAEDGAADKDAVTGGRNESYV